MKFNTTLTMAIFGFYFAIAGCSRPEAKAGPVPDVRATGYWLSGSGELTTYKLKQARYGNINEGELILITVTEPFNTRKQVKSDTDTGPDIRTALKAQTIRKFKTGIYDYTMTTTSFVPWFAPVGEHAFKISGTSVEWCGQTFLQLNRHGNSYDVQSRSYFESEGDEDFQLPVGFSEDEIWQRLRMNPADLPVGSLKVIPSLVSTRLRHRKLSLELAVVKNADYSGSQFSGKNLRVYSLSYAPGLPQERTVEFIYESTFPYRITAYTETYLDGFQKPKKLQTVAVLHKQIKLDYWRTHDPEHLPLRKKLGLD
jgi:hypothetical protein